MMTDALAGIAYSVAGFVVGFGCGRLSRDVHEIRETVVPQDDTTRGPHYWRHGFWRWTDPRVLGVALLGLSILTLVFAFIGSQALTTQAQCQSDYNVRFAAAYQARSRSADGDRKALNTMMLAIANAAATGNNAANHAKAKAAFEAYIAQIQTSDAQRKLHPLPAAPNPEALCH